MIAAVTLSAGWVLVGNGWCDAAAWRLPAGMSETSAGEVRINRTPARYAIVSLPKGPRDLLRDLHAQGWKAVPTTMPLTGPNGILTVHSFEREGRLLYTASAGADEDWAVVAEFAARPTWAGATGDVPGREPLGLPRFGGARRVLHLEGRGYEAACYRASARPRALLAEASARLTAVGWTVTPVSVSGLSAARPGAPPVALFADASGSGSTLLVLAGTLTR